MSEKKTNVITFRTEDWIKEELSKIANHNQWSIAQTVNAICTNYLINPYPGKIIVKSEDLINAAIKIRSEGIKQATELKIDVVYNESKEMYEKRLNYTVLLTGGLGAINDFDPIKEIPEEEILDIP